MDPGSWISGVSWGVDVCMYRVYLCIPDFSQIDHFENQPVS